MPMHPNRPAIVTAKSNPIFSPSPQPLVSPKPPPEPRPPAQSVPDIRGKHRRQAELNRLNQEIRLLQEELEKLERTQSASVACEDMVRNIDNTRDPLLPVTIGPADSAWDRWFERPPQAQSCCWM